ncbi:ATP-binding cassette domain-containing protein [Nocardioides sp. MAH-18]|uniref:ATP-binding cassette domain-containing protein n=1 Tax=Nocardioides agri TaxID=2682843 RepID=A0A6L6XNG1_9ACTN|nr:MULTISPECIES: ABC transporter ATP-binding protein [unclassified Nocardioides]MBA2953395.1 ABC transporter ATP-binding protein [Nocardioides sp. CGMCC 1.13656]MVQ48263.1 ATP-binding cassette domain-containing protein [Nocardioides sp. MAH-18]
MSTTLEADRPVRPAPPGPADPARTVDWRRLRSPIAVTALVACAIAAVSTSLGSVVAGRLAEHASTRLVGLLALCVVGAAVLDTAARTLWAGVVDRAEGKLRADLLDAALHQPLEALTEQAVGEVLDRVDDDTHEVGTLLRQSAWMAIRTVLASGPLWLVAGLTWWPAFFLFPVAGVAALGVVRPLLPQISARKVEEEMAWTDHAAAMEEGVAGRDDLRASLGQAHVLRRCTELAATVHRRFAIVLELEARVSRRTGSLLHAVLAATALVGIALVEADHLDTSALVTLFLVTTMFVGQVDQMARHLPDLQAGFGAVLRLRGLLGAEPEPIGGADLPAGRLDVSFRDLHFAYVEARFALQHVDLHVPAGTTCALVGRTGSGKSTLASLLSRAVEPERGSVLLGGVDVLDLDLQRLRAAVGVVTQRTEILAGTLCENITLFGDVPRADVEAAVVELGLDDWVAGLSDGLDTLLGPGGTTLSAGEEQLVAFARLLVRDVRVVVLDEATARMDPVTEAHVVRASDRLLAGRTGLLVAHRLSTTERAEQVAVLDGGKVVQRGLRSRLAAEPGPFRALLTASAEDERVAPEEAAAETAVATQVGTARRVGAPPAAPDLEPVPSLARATLSTLLIEPQWGVVAIGLFLFSALTGAFGVLTGWAWGHLVETLQRDGDPTRLTVALVASLLVSPLLLAAAIRRYPRWWVGVMLRVRTSVLAGQTDQHRLRRTPPGEVVARTMDADRIARYADRWVDFVNGLLIAAVTAIVAQSLLAGGVLLAVMVVSALASTLGRPVAGRSAAASASARARFGRSLVSALDSVRTVKLAASTPSVHAHLRAVDSGRVEAAVREHRVQAMLDGVPIVMVQCGVVTAWAVMVAGGWGLATALLVAGAVNGFDWFGRVAGAVVTEAPGTRSWMRTTSRLAGGGDLMHLPDGVDLVAGAAPAPEPGVRDPLRTIELRGLTAVHDDGTIGVSDVDLTVHGQELVLLLGQVGSGKSSLLSALAGLVSSTGEIRWNDEPVGDPQVALRPGRVAHVAQVPRVLSGTFADNIHLDHPDREVLPAIETARLASDVASAGGPESLVGHRGVRLSGGQVQRLALARGLACDAELLLADDVSSALDAATEIELWTALRERGATVVGATSKRAALAQADRVVVLVEGRVAASGPWSELAPAWGHLAG